jgi:hypothetical protein
MGRTREKSANRIKVSLYIVKAGGCCECEGGMVPGGFCGRMESWGADEDEDGTRPFDTGKVDRNLSCFYTGRGSLHDVNPMHMWRGRRRASVYRRIAPGGPSRCAIRTRRGGSGDMPRAMPYSRG